MGGSHTTLGDGALDFRVRNGNGYDSSSMATGLKAGIRELKRTTARRDEIPRNLKIKQSLTSG